MQLDTLITIMSVGMSCTVIIFVLYEAAAYQKRKTLFNLSTTLKNTNPKNNAILKKRDKYLRNFIHTLVPLTINLINQINLVKKQLISLRHKALKAGIRSKNAPAIILLAKLSVAILMTFLFYSYVTPALIPKYSYIPLLLISILIGYSLPDLYLLNEWQKRSAEVMKNWSDFIDVILVSVSSGQTIEAGIRRASFEMANISPELAKEFLITVTELSLLETRLQAYERLGERLPFPFVDNFIFDVMQSETIGTPIVEALTKIADDNRLEKTQRVEKKAAALGPKLTVPMIVFFFPILFVVVLVPAFL